MASPTEQHTLATRHMAQASTYIQGIYPVELATL